MYDPSTDTGTIDLNPPDNSGQIDLGAPQVPTLNTSQATTRSQIYDYGAGQNSPGQDVIYNQIISGQEDQFRNYVSKMQDVKTDTIRSQMLTNIAQSGKPVTPQDYNFVMSLNTKQMSDPNTSIEDLYSRRILNDLYSNFGSNTTDVQGSAPTLRQDAYNKNWNISNVIDDIGEQTLSKRLQVQKILDDSGEAESNLPGYAKLGVGIGAVVNSAIPFLRQYELHNAIADSSDGNFLTGTDLQDQYSKLAAMPPDQFHTVIQATKDRLYASGGTPLVQDFFRGFQSYTKSQAGLDNLFNLADVAAFIDPALKGVEGVAGGADAAAKAVSGIRGVTRNPGSLSSDTMKVLGLTKPIPPADSATASYGGNFFDTDLGKQLYAHVGPPKPADMPVTDLEQYKHQNTQSFEDSVRELRDTGISDQKIAKQLGTTEEEVSSVNDSPEPVDFFDTDLGKQLYSHIGPPKPADYPLTSYDPVEQYATSVKNTVASIDPAAPDIREAAAAAGRNDLAEVTHYQDMTTPLDDHDPIRGFQQLVSNLPSFLDPPKWFRGAFKLAREDAAGIADMSGRTSSALMDSLSAGNGITSTSTTGLAQAFETSRQTNLERLLQHTTNDAVLDFERVFPGESDRVMPEKSIANTGYNVFRLGRPGGHFFDTPEEAALWRSSGGYGIPDAQVRHSGQGYFLQVARPINLKSPEVLNALLDAKDAVTPRSKLTSVLNSFGDKGAPFAPVASRVSDAQLGARQVFVQQPTQVIKDILDNTKALPSLSKSSKRDLERFMDVLRRQEYVDPTGIAQKGVQITNQGQLEAAWSDVFKRNPTKSESAAFVTAQNINMYEYVLDNLSFYSHQVRQGMMKYTQDGVDAFQGVERKSINWDNPEGTIRLYNAETGEVKNYPKALTKASTREELNELVDNEGYKLIQTSNPFQFDSPVHFVMTKTAKVENIPYQQIPFKGTGHIGYDYQNFVKQAKTSQGGYDRAPVYHTNDVSVMPVTSEAQAKQIAENLETARGLYNNKSLGEMTRFMRQNIPGIDPEKFIQKLKNGTLDPSMPFVHVKSGQSTMDTQVYKNLFKGGQESWRDSNLNLLKGAQTQFTGHRGWDISGIGQATNEDNPIFESLHPRLVDPLPMMATALQRAVRNKYIQDYQLLSAEHFVEEFSHTLKAAPIEELRENPIAVLANPKWDVHAEPSELAAAKGYRDAVMNLLGTQTEYGKATQWIKTKLLNSVYNNFGEKASDFAYEKVLSAIPSPLLLARSLAFHLKLGLFNPVQFFLQSQTAAQVLALSPVHGVPGAAAGWMMRLLHAGESTDAVAHFGRIAERIGWKAEDFTEAYNLMKRSGVFNIGPQHAWKDDILDPSLFTQGSRSFFDKGMAFFNEGERSNHMAGLATAYREWRSENKFATMDRAAESKILARYDDLTGNMTHASSTALNRGFLSVPGQFFTYTERLAEGLLWGRRLTPVQKVRAFAVYSALYGVPIGLAAETTYPFYNDFREALLRNGNTNYGPAVEGLMQGIPETFLHWATGTEFDVGSRMGPNGQQLVHDAVHGDANLLEAVGGASASILGSTLASAQPLWHDVQQGLSHDPNFSGKIATNDLIDVAKNISTVSNAGKIFMAMNAHKYVTTGQVTVDNNVSTLEGLMMGITGMTPTRINDVSATKDLLKGMNAAQTKARQQMTVNWQRYWNESDPKTAQDYLAQVRYWAVLGGFTPQEEQSIMSSAIGQYKDEETIQKLKLQNKIPDLNPILQDSN